MTCELCGLDVTGTRCDCGWKVPSLAQNGQGEWVVGHCEVPGCGVRIRYRLGQAVDLQCKWHQAGTARYTVTRTHLAQEARSAQIEAGGGGDEKEVGHQR